MWAHRRGGLQQLEVLALQGENRQDAEVKACDCQDRLIVEILQ
jgi:hypothetical protein